MPTMTKMVDELAERVYKTLNYFIQEYYNGYDPKSYSHQYDFLRSVVKVEPKIVGNKVTASVFIDTDYMDNCYSEVIRLHHGQIRDYMVDLMLVTIRLMYGTIP